jgi:hypothetical protein
MGAPSERDEILALGELRGLLAALAWANTWVDHTCTFTVEELPEAADIHAALHQTFDGWTTELSVVEIADWSVAVVDALRRWLFSFTEIISSRRTCSLTHEFGQEELTELVMSSLNAALRPERAWRVQVVPTTTFYECDWADFAIQGMSGRYLLHLGVSD